MIQVAGQKVKVRGKIRPYVFQPYETDTSVRLGGQGRPTGSPLFKKFIKVSTKKRCQYRHAISC